MGLRSLVAQYFAGPMGSQLVSSHDEKYANTGAENPYLEQIINQSNHSGVTKYASEISGFEGGGSDVGGAMDTGSDLGNAAVKKGGGGAMNKISGGVKGTANHKDMFNQPIGEDGSMGTPTWSKEDAINDFKKEKSTSGGDNSVNLFRGGGAGSDLGNRLVNASLPDSWKKNIAPWTPQNIYGTAGKSLIQGAKSLFGSNGGDAENEFGDIDLD